MTRTYFENMSKLNMQMILLLGTNNLSDQKVIWKEEEVEKSKCVKYLGVTIDRKLTFE